jgi:hypothetical protein
MKTNLNSVRVYAAVLCLAMALVVAMGCGSEKSTEADRSGAVNIMVSAGGWATGLDAVLGAGPVEFESIESFLVTIDRITIQVSAEDDSLAGVVVFDASEQPAVDNQVDLVDLSKLNEIVSSVPVPAGDYKQVRMEISDPHLRLVDDPPGEDRTDVHLTANGRLFAGVDLTIAPEETLDLNLVLNDLHLVEQGNGGFVLTPQLRVEIAPVD